MSTDPNDGMGRMAGAAYTVSTVIAIALIWIWLAVLVMGIARNAPVTYTDIMTGGALTFGLSAAIYFAGWGWRRFWTGRKDHFFTRN